MADLEPGVILSADTVAAMERLSTSPRTAMTEQHKATPDDWAQQESWAYRNSFSDSSCIIELRDRVAALEAAQQPRAFTGQVVAPITNQTGTGVGVSLYLDPSEEQHGVTSDRLIARDTPAPASSLVKRIKHRLIKGIGGTWEETSCDVIREVAAWLRRGDAGAGSDWGLVSNLLDNEANR